MKDGVYPRQFEGAEAYAIVWKGRELAMLWGKRNEARLHLWQLRNPEKSPRGYKADLKRRDKCQKP